MHRIDWRFDSDCKCIASGTFEAAGGNSDGFVALAPDESTIVVASGNLIHIFRLPDGKLLESITAMASECRITGLVFDSESRIFASSGTDKHIHLWHNKPGLQEKVIAPTHPHNCAPLHFDGSDGRWVATMMATIAMVAWVQ